MKLLLVLVGYQLFNFGLQLVSVVYFNGSKSALVLIFFCLLLNIWLCLYRRKRDRERELNSKINYY